MYIILKEDVRPQNKYFDTESEALKYMCKELSE